ncbi:MAG: hypothetical protein ACE5KM_13135, partial [Planctomycetaceae bacterium]
IRETSVPEVGTFGRIVSNEAVGAFVGAAQRCAVRFRKVRFPALRFGAIVMLREFPGVFVCFLTVPAPWPG